MSTIKEYPFDEPPVTSQPTGRRVSIVTEPTDPRNGYDNHGFERNRKISSGNSEVAEIGPARRKSILHNSIDNVSVNSHHSIDRPTFNDFRIKKVSTTESINSRRFNYQLEDNIHRSWWYLFCKKCHGEDSTPSWEPPHWQKICPYPMCPTYRQFAQIIGLVLIGILGWGIVYAVIGSTAAPGGQVFGLAALALCAHFGGFLMFKLTTLPALIGMLLVGILMQNIGLVDLESNNFSVVPKELRKFALVIILTRAGLDLDPPAMKKLFLTVLKLGLIPWTVECCVIAIMTHFLLNLPWDWAFLLGSIIAAVSPAVVVPCLFRLRGKGYGVAKGIPTLVLAVAGIDDAASVAIFGIIFSVMFSTSSLTYTIIQGPISIIGGIAFGALWGYLLKYIPEKGDPFVIPLRVLLLLFGGLLAVLGSEKINYDGAGPLAVITAAFVSCLHWTRDGWEVDSNPVATAFEIFWMIFEPLLFGITGAGVKVSGPKFKISDNDLKAKELKDIPKVFQLDELDSDVVAIGVGCLFTGVIIRILVTAGVGFGSNLNTKEKFFVGLSWMAKATVQAALGPIALDAVKNSGDPTLIKYAENVLTMCILSIVVTAPTGAILISISGPKLLTKTRKPQVIEGWRRSHRPSIRDISIIDEEEEKENSDDTEAGVEDKTTANTIANQS